MICKKLIPLVLILSATALFAQSNVAVMNSVLGEGVPINASAIVSDSINEQYVKTAQYTAIDRAYITSIQEEKRFQLSGQVKEEDIKELGTAFGADYICIPYVGLLGSTYSVSARLIEVETAEVVLQESHRMQGEIDVLFVLAEVVGAKLTGADLATAIPVALADATPEPEHFTDPRKQLGEDDSLEPAADPYVGVEGNSRGVITDPRRHFVLSWMFPGYSGDEDPIPPNGFALYDQHSYLEGLGGYDSAKARHIGIDFHMLFPVWKFVYLGGGLTYTKESLYAENAGFTYTWDNFNTFEPYFSAGGVVAFFDIFQVYGGITLGGLFFVLGEGYGDDAIADYWPEAGEMAVGFSIGFELGISAYWKIFGIDLRYKWSQSPSMVGDVIFSSDYAASGGDTSFGHHGLTLGVGFMY